MKNHYAFFGGKNMFFLLASGMLSTTVVVSAFLSSVVPAQFSGATAAVSRVSAELSRQNLAAVVTLSSGAKADFDVNKDGYVNAGDISLLASSLQSNPNQTSTSSLDLNKDAKINSLDWALMTRYFSVHAGVRYLFIVQGTSTLTASDVQIVANALQSSIGSAYNVRFDFDADGRNSPADWAMLTEYVSYSQPVLLYDVDGSGAANGNDVQIIANGLQSSIGSAYNVRFDFDADGRNSPFDWLIVLNYFNNYLKNPLFLYDVDGSGAVNGNDVQIIANGLQGSIGSAYNTRFDFDGDGRNSPFDWQIALTYLTSYLKSPLYIYDVDGTGVVNATDVQIIANGLQASIGSAYNARFDLDGDGRNSPLDWHKAYTYIVSYKLLGASWFDTNGDGLINATDINAVKGSMNKAYNVRMDMNTDGLVNQMDVDLIGSY